MARNVTFITKKVKSGCEFDNQNALFTDKRNDSDHFWDVHFVTWDGSGNGKVQKVSPKGIDWQRETAKMTKWTPQKWPETLRLSLKKWNQVANLTTRIHFLLINVSFWTIFDMLILSLWRVAKMVKCKKSDPKALTDTGRLQKAQTENLKNDPMRYVYH